jgi:hypothetical protein
VLFKGQARVLTVFVWVFYYDMVREVVTILLSEIYLFDSGSDVMC